MECGNYTQVTHPLGYRQIATNNSGSKMLSNSVGMEATKMARQLWSDSTVLSSLEYLVVTVYLVVGRME